MHPANSQAVKPAKRFDLHSLINECSAKIAIELPRSKIVGKFFLARRSNNGAGTLDKLVNPGDVVALAAPSTNPNLFGLTNRGYTGCSYNIANGTLSFQ